MVGTFGCSFHQVPTPWIPCFTTVTLEMNEHHAACLTDINPFRKHLSNRIIVLRRMQQNWNFRSSTFLGVTYELTYISTMFDYQRFLFFSLFHIKPLDSSRCQWNPHELPMFTRKIVCFFCRFSAAEASEIPDSARPAPWQRVFALVMLLKGCLNMCICNQHVHR